MLQQYLIVFNEHSKVLLKKIHPLANTDKAFDVWSYMINFNLDVITRKRKFCDTERAFMTTQVFYVFAWMYMYFFVLIELLTYLIIPTILGNLSASL